MNLSKVSGDIPTHRVESILSLSKGAFNIQPSSFNRPRPEHTKWSMLKE